MAPTLTDEQRLALEREHGGPIRVDAEDGTYVLMSLDMYRSMMGVGSDEEFAASVASVKAAMDDARAGRSRPFEVVLRELAERHGLSR